MPRCPNKHRRNKKTGLCDKVNKNVKTKVNKKKCPKGKVLNIKTNRCNNIKKNVKKTVKKICPDGKILNLKTNRCINNNTINKNKLNSQGVIHALPSLVKPLNINLSPPKKSSILNIFTKHCSKYKKIKEIDINKITLIKQSNKFKIIYNKTDTLKDIKFLSKGGYGEVYSYSNGDIEIALKSFFNQKDDEIKIIRLLKKLNIPCEIVNCKLLKNDNKYFAAMDLMNGPLSKIGKLLNPDNILKVIKTIAKHLECLNDKKLTYTDLKTDNILFKCLDGDILKIVLGDVGGICKHGEQNAATWLPWEARYLKGFPRCGEKTMVWCLGVVIVEMLHLNTDPFYWDNIYKYNDNLMKDYIYSISENKKMKELKNKIPFPTIFRQMMDLDPKKRISLSEIIKKID